MESTPANKRLGTHMEERRADARNGEHTPDVEHHDVLDDGEPVEVKTTAMAVENPESSRKGRYQLEGENHHRLIEEGGSYDFVLRDEEDEVVDVATRTAEEVESILVERGRKWPKGSKLKLPWDQIHSLRGLK